MNPLETLKLIADEASRGELNFPTGIDVSLKIVRLLDDPDCHVDRAIQLIRGEPLIAARVVAVANSTLYCRNGQTVTDLRNAIARIGLRTTRTLTVAIATRQMAGHPQNPAVRAMAARLWEHTAHVAALANVLARRVTHQDPETAFFAGIVHEIGSFYLLSRATDFPGLLEGELADWNEQMEPVIGRAILARLDIPETVTTAIETLWSGFLALPPVTLGDTLLLADELATVPSPLFQSASATRNAEPAVIDSFIDHDTLSSILTESAADIESLYSALSR